MSRNYQIQDEDKLHFLTLTVVQWLDVFTRPFYKDIITESLKFCQEKKGLELFAWCIMTNHLHIIARAKEGYKLSDIIRDFKKFTSKQIVQEMNKDSTESRREWMLWVFKRMGHKNGNNQKHQFWQQNNNPIALTSNKMMEERLEYIHQNPVKAGFVWEAKDYPYSSATDYSGTKGMLPINFIE